MYHYEKEKYEEYLPNPGWRTLHMRCIELGSMMVRMGLPYVLEKQGYDYEWNSTSFQEIADRVKQEKTRLLDWCRGKGMEMELTYDG